jgi:putative transposase
MMLISTFAAFSDGGFIPSLKAARRAEARSAMAKDVHDASWAKFISMMRYKAACAGGQLVEVDPHNTSQDCSCCGSRVPKTLHDRLHSCRDCGLVIDRDLNAARNVLHRAGMGPGLRNVAGAARVQAETSMRV